MEAEQARTRSEDEHRKTAAHYNTCIGHMKQLEKKLKRSINKSRSEILGLVFFVSSLSPRLGLFISECFSVRERERKRGLRCSCHLMQSRCFMCRWCSTRVCFSSESQRMWLCREFSPAPLPLSHLLLFCRLFRPYFELKAKYYLQLEVQHTNVTRSCFKT